MDKVVDMPVVVQRQVPMVQTVLETVEGQPSQLIGRAIELLVVKQIPTCGCRVCSEIPQLQFIAEVVDVRVVQIGQVPHDPGSSEESVGAATAVDQQSG